MKSLLHLLTCLNQLIYVSWFCGQSVDIGSRPLNGIWQALYVAQVIHTMIGFMGDRRTQTVLSFLLFLN